MSVTGKTSTPSSSRRRQSPGTTTSRRQRLQAAGMDQNGSGQQTVSRGQQCAPMVRRKAHKGLSPSLGCAGRAREQEKCSPPTAGRGLARRMAKCQHMCRFYLSLLEVSSFLRRSKCVTSGSTPPRARTTSGMPWTDCRADTGTPGAVHESSRPRVLDDPHRFSRDIHHLGLDPASTV